MARLGTLRRFLVVAWAVVPLAWTYLRDRRRYVLVGGRRRPSPEAQRARAETLLATFIELGPTFIKLGQLLSTRPDIVPAVYIDELSRLQDDVPPAPWPGVERVIEAELGPVDDVFTDFDPDAISGASLGQVYEAELDGQQVAVKVRRPGVTATVETDLRVIRWWVRLVLPLVDEARAFSLRNLSSEFGRVIRQEMDYEREARMLMAIRDQFDADPSIIVPQAIEGYSTDRVLTMEYVGGTKITDVEALDRQGIDRRAVAERLERAYLQMIVLDGVFHADPHPGNLAVKPDGSIVFYDFGMSGRVDPADRQRIVEFYVAVGERDIEGIIDALVALRTLSADVDRRVMGEVLELAIQDARGERIEEWQIQQLMDRVESTIYQFPLRLPARLALVMRVATVVEGVCVTLDPDFDFIAVATDFLREQGYYEATVRRNLRQTGESVQEAGRAVLRAAPTAERVLDRFERDDAYIRVGVEDTADVVAELARRLVYGMAFSAGLVAAAIVYGFRGPDPVLAVPATVSVLTAVLLLRSFRGQRGISTRPSFTRYQLRERQEDGSAR